MFQIRTHAYTIRYEYDLWKETKMIYTIKIRRNTISNNKPSIYGNFPMYVLN